MRCHFSQRWEGGCLHLFQSVDDPQYCKPMALCKTATGFQLCFCKWIKSVFTLSSPASGETKHQSRETFGRMNYLYLLMGALNLDTNTDFCPLLIEAEFPFLAIEEEKRSWMFTSQPKIG